MKALLGVVVIQPTYHISSFDFVSGSSTQLVSVGDDGVLGQGGVSTAPSIIGAAASDSRRLNLFHPTFCVESGAPLPKLLE